MPNTKQVCLTNSNKTNLSRFDLIKWVNNTINTNYTKVEQMCTGEAYCKMMELLQPNCIAMYKVKLNTNQEYQFLENFKVFQAALGKLHCDHQVPMNRLAKGKFQDNLEFLQWFHKFYVSQAQMKIGTTAEDMTEVDQSLRSAADPEAMGDDGVASETSAKRNQE